MKTYFILIALLFVITTLTAQTITGKVADEQSKPIEFANVALYSLPDSALITGTVTNQQGGFSLNPNGNGGKPMFLQISFIGYETQIVPATSGQTVVLKNDSKLLGEVVVQGNLPRIEIKNDALVTTVQNTVLSKAGTGNDVLKRLPSITGDKGVFSVFGKGEAKIYINNREMRDVSELDNLNSADIKNVEIVNNPGARYDASVKAVIRINTVRRVGDGFSFDVRSSYYQSQNVDLREQLNVNYRKNGLDIFGTFSYLHDEWIQDSKLWQKTYVDTLWRQDNTLYLNGINNTITGIAGANYEISPNHYAGIKYTLSVSPGNKWFSTAHSTVLANGTFYDEWNSYEDKTSVNKPAHRINAYYNGMLGKLNIDFNADFYTAKQSTEAIVTETSKEYDNRTVTSENNVNNRLFASKLVLSYPVLGGTLSLGSEYTNTHRDDIYRNKESFVPSTNTSINEQNTGFFAEYSRMIPVGQLTTGLRYENVNSEYFSSGKKMNDQSRRYGQWFPNISLATKVGNVSAQLSYTAKIRRPTYRQLSSNVFYVNRFSMQSGNPYLKPTTTHDITLVGSWRFIQLMTSYKNETDAIIFWTEQMKENPKISIVSFRNLDKLPSITAFLSASPTFGIWTPQASVGFVKQWLTIRSNNVPVKLNKATPFASLNNSFSLPNGFLITLDTRFQGKGDYQNIYLSENQFVVNAGITKSFLNDQLRVELKGHDLFRGKKDGNLLYNAQMELFQLNRNDSREVELTIRYKFNSARSKYKGKGAGESEINRM